MNELEEWTARCATLTEDELRDIAGHLDRDRFPERARIVDAELRRRPGAPRSLWNDERSFAPQFRYLRRLEVALIWLPWCFAAAWLIAIPCSIVFRSIFAFAGIPAVGGLIHLAATRLWGFRCPRCGEFFTASSDDWPGFVAASACAHCGLRRDAYS